VAPFGGPHAFIPHGPFVIVRLLPLVGDKSQYRVRSTVDGHERVVTSSRSSEWGRGRITVKPTHLGGFAVGGVLMALHIALDETGAR
jgi:hypothetical protein